jgi:hypothetical protein
VERIDIVDEDADRAVPGLAWRLGGGDQVQGDVARAQPDIEGGLAVFESDVEAQLVAVIGEALHDVLDGEDGGAAAHHRALPGFEVGA